LNIATITKIDTTTVRFESSAVEILGVEDIHERARVKIKDILVIERNILIYSTKDRWDIYPGIGQSPIMATK